MGGVLPLALVPVLAWAMPESVRFLVMRGGETQRVVATLRRIAPEANLEAAIFAGARKPHGSPMRQLLGGVILSFGWSLPAVFAVVAVPAVMAGLALFAMGVVGVVGSRLLAPLKV